MKVTIVVRSSETIVDNSQLRNDARAAMLMKSTQLSIARTRREFAQRP